MVGDDQLRAERFRLAHYLLRKVDREQPVSERRGVSQRYRLEQQPDVVPRFCEL